MMLDEPSFRRHSEDALHALKQALIAAEEKGGFEAEDNHGVLNVMFEDGASKFVFTPQTPVRQVWISARSTSFKLEWSEAAKAFILPKSGETLRALTERLLQEQMGDTSLQLG